MGVCLRLELKGWEFGGGLGLGLGFELL